MLQVQTTNNTEQIRKLNDAFRYDPHNASLGQLVLTAGVSALNHENLFALIQEVKTFEDFTKDNDPYGEHDFGEINFRKVKYFWKIDYYDLALKFHSQDKANPQKTRRVLTIMLAEEY